MSYLQASPPGSNTEDIIQALARAVPAATKQIKPFVEQSGKTSAEPVEAALYFGNLVKRITRYKRDGLDTQLIVLPAKMKGNAADCKSFALFNVAAMAALGIPAGLRFASYKSNRIPTHVYNWIEVDGKKFAYDSTMPNLRESKKFTYLRDMKVAYLAGSPVMVEDTAEIGSRRRERRQRNRDNRQQNRQNRRAQGKPNRVKKIALAPARGPFLALVRLNFRGIASKLSRLNQRKPKTVKDFWLRLGGDPAKLAEAIAAGAPKKPLFGSQGVNAPYSTETFADDYNFIGEPATAATLIAAAGSILLAVRKLFKKEGKEFEDESLAPVDATPIDDGSGFAAADPETPEAQRVAARAEKATPGILPAGGGFQVNPLFLGGAALAAYLIFKPKKRRA